MEIGYGTVFILNVKTKTLLSWQIKSPDLWAFEVHNSQHFNFLQKLRFPSCPRQKWITRDHQTLLENSPVYVDLTSQGHLGQYST